MKKQIEIINVKVLSCWIHKNGLSKKIRIDAKFSDKEVEQLRSRMKRRLKDDRIYFNKENY